MIRSTVRFSILLLCTLTVQISGYGGFYEWNPFNFGNFNQSQSWSQQLAALLASVAPVLPSGLSQPVYPLQVPETAPVLNDVVLPTVSNVLATNQINTPSVKTQVQTGLSSASTNRSFVVDYVNDQFLMDGKTFQYISGEFHYFRALPQVWRTRLRAMKAAGLNAVQTYVEWSTINPLPGVYKWDGINDVEQFIRIAAEEGLYVILRPGPYICAERDFGGFPYWLVNKYPSIKLRTSDPVYLNEVRIWYEQLMPRLQPFFYGNGGPVIMVQIENEYGSFSACDGKYMEWLRDETEKYTQGNAVLFTNDIPPNVKCGKTKDVLATLDFPYSNLTDTFWKMLRQYQPHGPLVSSEYYAGWLTWWLYPETEIETKPLVDNLDSMLSQNASVNFYMFFGGSNFNFMTGANYYGPGRYAPQITSYDYNAPMDEAGDPRPRYTALREVIGKHFPLPNVPVPVPAPKMSVGPVVLQPLDVILSETGRCFLKSRTEQSLTTTTFEAFNQFSGFLLFETNLPQFTGDPMTLTINGLRDRGYVYIDRMLQGILSREINVTSMPLKSGVGETLQILVENQGRVNYNNTEDFKGILNNVTLGSQILYNYNITGFPFEDYQKIQNLLNTKIAAHEFPMDSNIPNYLETGPTLYRGSFALNGDIYDTYLNPMAWGKGVAFVNGFNLGRYWPAGCPEITLYVPKELLKQGQNEVVLLELEQSPLNGTITFDSAPNLAGYKNAPIIVNIIDLANA